VRIGALSTNQAARSAVEQAPSARLRRVLEEAFAVAIDFRPPSRSLLSKSSLLAQALPTLGLVLWGA
jgi:hypothetical protein